MRKAITIGIVLVMVLMGFVALASPIAAVGPTIEKTMFVDGSSTDKTAWLGDKVLVTITVENVPDGGGTVTDDLPDMFAYVLGSFTVVYGDAGSMSIHKGVIEFDVGEYIDTKVTYKILYDSAPPNNNQLITNFATLEYSGGSTSGEDTIEIEDYCGFHKGVDFILDENGKIMGDDGDGIIEVGEDIQWNFYITVANPRYDWIMTDIVIKDRFGAEIEADGNPVVTQGSAWLEYKKGKSAKMTLIWDVGELFPFEPTPVPPDAYSARLDMLISTGTNPSGKQSYTSPSGCRPYELNSGAVLKFLNPDDIQLSAHTGSIYVDVFEQDGLPLPP